MLSTAEKPDIGPGLDLEYENEVTITAPEPALYETAYVTSHKGNCRAGAFSPDGALCATGSADASIKVNWYSITHLLKVRFRFCRSLQIATLCVCLFVIPSDRVKIHKLISFKSSLDNSLGSASAWYSDQW